MAQRAAAVSVFSDSLSDRRSNASISFLGETRERMTLATTVDRVIVGVCQAGAVDVFRLPPAPRPVCCKSVFKVDLCGDLR